MTHQIVQIFGQRICLGKVAVAEQVHVEIRHRDRIDAGEHGVGRIMADTLSAMDNGRTPQGKITPRNIKGRTFRAPGIQAFLSSVAKITMG